MSSLTESETATKELEEAKLAEDTLEEGGDRQQASSEDIQMDTSERAVKIEVSREIHQNENGKQGKLRVDCRKTNKAH